MKLTRNQRLAIIYASIFNSKLSLSEAKLWAINLPIKLLNSYTFKPSKAKYVQPKIDISAISKIPSVEAIFLTGSLAINSLKKDADIDLMIITLPHTLWLTRALIFIQLKMQKLIRKPDNFKDKICPNIFLDTNHLEITNRNLYTAHEVLQAKCLFDRGVVEKTWLQKNSWTKKYLPQAYSFKIKNCKLNNSLKIKNCKLKIILLPLELLAFLVQYLYMLPKITNEKVGLGYAFFHPNDLSEIVLKKFQQRLLKYTSK